MSPLVLSDFKDWSISNVRSHTREIYVLTDFGVEKNSEN